MPFTPDMSAKAKEQSESLSNVVTTYEKERKKLARTIDLLEKKEAKLATALPACREELAATKAALERHTASYVQKLSEEHRKLGILVAPQIEEPQGLKQEPVEPGTEVGGLDKGKRRRAPAEPTDLIDLDLEYDLPEVYDDEEDYEPTPPPAKRPVSYGRRVRLIRRKTSNGSRLCRKEQDSSG
jgi:hypothetical protein